MFSLFNFSSIFPGGSADPICPYVRTPMAVTDTVDCTVEGYIPGLCDSTSLTVGSRYVILAHSVGRNDVYSVSATMQADWLQLPNYTRACGLQKVYPLGATEFG